MQGRQRGSTAFSLQPGVSWPSFVEYTGKSPQPQIGEEERNSRWKYTVAGWSGLGRRRAKKSVGMVVERVVRVTDVGEGEEGGAAGGRGEGDVGAATRDGSRGEDVSVCSIK